MFSLLCVIHSLRPGRRMARQYAGHRPTQPVCVWGGCIREWCPAVVQCTTPRTVCRKRQLMSYTICMCRGSSFSIRLTGHFSSASGSTVWFVNANTCSRAAAEGPQRQQISQAQSSYRQKVKENCCLLSSARKPAGGTQLLVPQNGMSSRAGRPGVREGGRPEVPEEAVPWCR